MSELVLSTALHNCNPHSSPLLLEHNLEISSFPFCVDQRRDPHTVIPNRSLLGKLFKENLVIPVDLPKPACSNGYQYHLSPEP